MGEVVLAYDPDLHRRVAVKVLRGGAVAHAGAPAVQRMLREARAMAKVSHPNVITVFEVDQAADGQNFIAMEYVDGGTLRAWAQAEHSWHEVLEVYTAAGRGLAAAHAQGLVHRDFKPDNVLIGRDGRVRVTDFGLVGALDESDTFEAADLAASLESLDTGRAHPSSEATLTRTGSLLGTPAYMAPEDAKHLDARSDQFSFCIALYEALYGERPFAGETLAELRSNVCDGRRRDVPGDTDVPGWVRASIERGLARDPDQRWPDMAALLSALDKDPGERKRRWIYGGTAVLLTSTALAFASRAGPAEQPPCDDGSNKLTTLWNDERSAALQTAFTKANPEAASEGFAAVDDAVSTFIAGWKAGHLDACEAHVVRKDQSAQMFDRRMLCLQRRTERLDALLGAFEQPDAATVAAADRFGGAVPSADTCADPEAMQSMIPPPDAPDTRKEWKRLQLAIDRADALGVAGREPQALEAYAEIREDVAAVGHPPLSARYLQNYGSGLIRHQQYTQAIEVLEGAPEAAARSDDPRIEANVWLLLARAYGFGLNDPKAGAWATRAAEVAAVRARDQARMQLNIQFTQAILAEQSGDYARAVSSARRAVEGSLEVFGRAHRNTSAAYGTLGNALHKSGDLEQARVAHETSLAIDRGLHDEPHPDIGHSLLNLGLLDEERGDYEHARTQYEEALSIYSATVGKTHGAYGTALLNLASNAASRLDFEDARKRYTEVLAHYEETLPPGHADFATVHVNLAEVSLGQGKLDKALAEAQEGLALRIAALDPAHPKVMLAHTTVGRVQLARGEVEAAERAFRTALKLADDALSPEHVDRIDILIGLGEVLIADGRTSEAKPLLQRAVELAADAPPAKLEHARAALERAG